MLNIKRNKQHIYRLLLLFIAIFLFINNGFAQPGLLQRQITVLPTQLINFGTFHVTGAGSITTGGGVVSLDQTSVTPAIFEIKLCQGRTVTIDYDYSVMIDGSNGGQLELIIGPTERGISGDEFPVENNCEFITKLQVGGKLVMPANVVPGTYTGSFPMSFTQK